MADRRSVLRWGSAALLGAALPGAAAALASMRPRAGSAGDAPTAPPALAFRLPLAVPAVLRPVSTAGGVDRFEIGQMEARQQILPGPLSTVWGYNGTFPGPTIEARSGRRVVVTHRNQLAVPTVVHLHGAVVPAASDGYPVDYVLPVGSAIGRGVDARLGEHARHGVAGIATGARAYTYPNEQPAATLWYHDHRMDFSGPQQYRGLAGFYLIHDDVEDALPLPRGARDLPLMIADRTFAEDGALWYPSRDPTLVEPGVAMTHHHSGMLGDTIVVNGVAWPFHEVDAALYRLRILNASNARAFELRLDPRPPGGFAQIGSDGGLLGRPTRHDSFVISPGERYDMIVDFSQFPPGTRVLLRNVMGEGGAAYVMRFDVARRARDDARVPDVLDPDAGLAPAGPAGPTSARTADRRFSFFSGPDGTGLPAMINMRSFDVARIDARPAMGTTEIWDITADPTHPVHLHLARFQVLSRNGGPPAAQDIGWKDTVFVPEGGMRLAVTFAGYRGKYVFHCHNLEHADAGMMANMEIV